MIMTFRSVLKRCKPIDNGISKLTRGALSQKRHKSDLDGKIYIIVAAVIIFFGVKTSKRKQADFNSNADFMNRQASERYQKGLQNQKMINLYQSNIQEMHKYETMVPEKHRNSADVGSIIQILKEDRAQTVDEAIALL